MLKLLKKFKPYLPSFLLVCLTVFGRSMADLKLPSIMADIINNGISSGDLHYILRMGGWMLLVALGGMACAIATSYLSSRNAIGFSRDLRNDVFRKIESFSQSDFDRFGTSSLITRSTNDIQQMQMVVMMGQRMILSAPIMFIGGILNVLRSDYALSRILIIALPAVLLTVVLIGRRATPLFQVMQKKLDYLNLVIREGLSGVRVVRAFNRDDYQQERFKQANEDLTNNSIRVNRLLGLQSPLMSLIMNFTIIAIIWMGSFSINTGDLMIGDMIAFIQYVGMILGALMGLSMIFIMLPRAAVSANRINEILEAPITIGDPENIQTLTGMAGFTLEFNHISFRYPGSAAAVLHDISFRAEPGQTVAIIGGTGSGKSSLANLLLRFYDIEQGSITFNGIDIRNLSLQDLRAKIGYVSQKALLFTGSIADNIRYGKSDATDEEIKEALTIAQASDFVLNTPDGIEAEVSQGGANFSGGQKQRLSIARALVRHAALYLFDDSFSALDFQTDANLRIALKEVTQDAIVIIIAQRVSTIMNADLILVMDEGRLVGKGTHEELLQSCRVYQEILSSQLSVEEYTPALSVGEEDKSK
ncbi:MAG: ABC transporter ATP-binding protein/permease [Negativicutes bacterium]|nr:ABC transporter ATP-binding protein/permease [Negativicutes bacterium]